MSIVSEKVDKLGGYLQIDTNKGVGTAFKITLPLTLATFRGIHLSASGNDFIMPTHYVKRVMRIHESDIKTMENRTAIQVNGKFLSFAYLRDLLNLPEIPVKQPNPTLCVLIIKAAEKSVAIGVDKIINEQEVLVKGLGKQLVHVPNILAATIMQWGKVIPILNPPDLVKSAITEYTPKIVRGR